MLKRHSCLAALPIIKDMTTMPEMASPDTAWEWAFAYLLPKVGVVAFSDLGLLRRFPCVCLWQIALSLSTLSTRTRCGVNLMQLNMFQQSLQVNADN
jgi:hypothetical protein